MTQPQAAPHCSKYARFWELHNIEKLTSDEGSDYFEFMPSKAKLNLHRGDGSKDFHPDRDEILEGLGAGELYVSGQDEYRKDFFSRVVSHNHASIRWMPNQQYPRIKDVGSTHGTYLVRLGSNVPWYEIHERMQEAATVEVKDWVALQDGDVIQLGKAVMRSKEQHQPAYLFVEMCEAPDDIGAYEEDEICPIEPKSQVLPPANKTKGQDEEINLISSDEEEVALVRPKRGHGPLDEDDSDVESTCNAGSIDVDVTKVDKKLADAEQGDFILQDTFDSDTESIDGHYDEEEILKMAAKDFKDSGESSSEESEEEISVASTEEEDEEVDDESSIDGSSVDEQDSEEIVDKEAIKLPDSSFHHDYEALIRADESYRENLVKQGMEEEEEAPIEEHIDEPIEAIVVSTVEAVVDETSISEVSGMMQTDEDSSQDEPTDSVPSSSPVIDKDSDCLTDATSENEEAGEVKDVKMLDKPTIILVEEEKVVECTEDLPQAAGKKRSHDELEEESEGAAVVVATSSSIAMQAPLPANKSPTFKKLKTFTAGLAAGILAGAVGTFMGLNSLVLDDPSFL